MGTETGAEGMELEGENMDCMTAGDGV